jgi:hypothetical protein
MLTAKYNDFMNARDMAKALGRRGGQSRAERLPAARRAQIASLGGAARARSLTVARRINDNLRYAAAVASLQGSSRALPKRTWSDGRLPGIYPVQS